MKIFYLFIFVVCNATTFAQPIQLVKDINIGGAGNQYFISGISSVTPIGSKTYFTADDGTSGREPWVTDGTASGTYMLRDINPGLLPSIGNLGADADAQFTYSNGLVFFKANDDTYGDQLWKTDGTAEGTMMVKAISISYQFGRASGAMPNKLCDVNGILYFVASINSFDYTLYRSDGTEAGTFEVSTRTISATGSPLYNFNGTLYFMANDGNLYRINGGITELVASAIDASQFTTVGNTLFFRGRNATKGYELWKTDGAAATMVKDINSGIPGSLPESLTNVNGMLLFTATDGVNGTELWKSDGTEAGTVMVKDITIANNNNQYKPTQLTDVNGILFFNGYTQEANKELWKSDGTEAGTVLVKDIVPGSSFPGGNPTDLINYNGSLIFVSGGSELWKSDGTEAGTLLINRMSSCQFLAKAGNSPGVVVFYAKATGISQSGYELWKTDGTTVGTSELKNVANDNPSSVYHENRVTGRFANANGKLFFRAENISGASYSLYGTTGSQASTTKLNEFLGTDNNLIQAKDAVNAGGIIYFAFSDVANGNELWKSSGTLAGTGMLKNINPGSSSFAEYFYNHNGIVYFSANNGTNGAELWKTDGTEAGTVMVKDIRPGSGSSSPAQFISFNGEVYFTANNGTNGTELWKTNGTEAGTLMLKDIYPGTQPGLHNGDVFGGNYFTVLGNQLIFSARTSTSSSELWKTDGTQAGTVLIKVVRNISYITAVGNKVFFAGANASNNNELWVSDGTNLGTYMAIDINPGPDPSSPNSLINFNGTLYFSAFEPATGFELWKTEGAGAVLVKDIEPGKLSGMQFGFQAYNFESLKSNIAQSNGVLYFPASTALHGKELWKSDGTSAGTIMVGDLFPGVQSSDPEQITSADGKIYFVADNGNSGKELFTFSPFDNFILPPQSVQDSINVNRQNTSLLTGTNQLIVNVQQSGAKPVDGMLKTSVTINATSMVYNGRTLYKKHVDVEPNLDAATATARVTIYFSQADFDAYNLEDNINGNLPSGPSDIVNKSHLRVIQYHGVGIAPGNYTGAEEIIDPADENIVWNSLGNYWEVSFPVTGFSGFYLSSAAVTVLPVRLVSFTGQLVNQNKVSLHWKVAEQHGRARYEVERSANGNNFNKVGYVIANNSNEFIYQFTDETPLSGNNFYRIKIIDGDGSITYSTIVTVVNRRTTVSLYPNPAKDYVHLQVGDNSYLNSSALLIDNTGKTVQKLRISSSNVKIDLSSLPAGVYFLKLVDGILLKFIK